MDILKKEDEIELYFNIRKEYITLSKPKNKKQLKLCEMYSNIFINIIFLKCRYSESTEKTIKNFVKKYKNKFNNNFNI